MALRAKRIHSSSVALRGSRSSFVLNPFLLTIQPLWRVGRSPHWPPLAWSIARSATATEHAHAVAFAPADPTRAQPRADPRRRYRLRPLAPPGLSGAALRNRIRQARPDRGTTREPAIAATSGRKPSLPARQLEQTAAVQSVLAPLGVPLTAAALAARFRQGRRVMPQVEAVLAALVRVGGLVPSPTVAAATCRGGRRDAVRSARCERRAFDPTRTRARATEIGIHAACIGASCLWQRE